MDHNRMKQLAGIGRSLKEQYQASVDELDLLEKMYPGKHGLDIDTDTESVEEVTKRLDAASRAMGLINRIKDKETRKKHLSRVMSNMNTISAALNHMFKQLG